ncbi:MAG: DUF308 domain-containing protein [Eubacteriales bacterium]|nr:DUF308 domain-containing protein [Eubacteriales bacterium]
MSTKSVRVLNIAAGVLLIAAGVYCLCNQDIAVLSAGLLLGLFMLVSGVIEIAVFAGTSGVLIGSGWLLLDGVLTVIMSLFLLFNQWFTLLSLPFLFTIWLLFSGISRFVSAFDLRALGVRAWGWVLAIGILLIVGGFVCMMDPWVSVVAIGVTVGIVFILEGVSAIVCACISKRIEEE